VFGDWIGRTIETPRADTLMVCCQLANPGMFQQMRI
jgi:hypothetical protein